ncbi:hypothetical protein RCL1_003947 [Eukaryota sp. TZLM3-RCL]
MQGKLSCLLSLTVHPLMVQSNQNLCIIRGAGELATAIAVRLSNVGLAVVCLELPNPLCVRTTISFASSILSETNSCTVEGIEAVHAQSYDCVPTILSQKKVAVLIADPLPNVVQHFQPFCIIDALMTKKGNNGLCKSLAPLVIALGPCFEAGKDAHFVVETCRGHDLGRIYSSGFAIPDTGIPGEIGSKTMERLLRAPCTGAVEPIKQIGDLVEVGDVVATVNQIPVYSEIKGIIRGMITRGVVVAERTKIGDVDPRVQMAKNYTHTITDKGRTISGSVLEIVAKYLFNN